MSGLNRAAIGWIRLTRRGYQAPDTVAAVTLMSRGVHRSAMADGAEPKIDMVVEFVEEADQRSGRPKAVNVRPVYLR